MSATNAGIAPSFDVYLLAIANASSGVGRIMTGLLADRIGKLSYLKRMQKLIHQLRGLGCMSVMIPGTLLAAIVTYAWPFATSLRSLIAVSIIYGFAFFHMGCW